MNKIEDLTGKRFNKLLVIERVENDKSGKSRWRCLCDCGNETVTFGTYLRRGHTKSCGKCIHRGPDKIDLSGQRFDRLFVESYHGEGNHSSLWDCLCDCGQHIVVSMSNLKSGHTRSCGCLSRELSKARMVDDLTGRKFGRWTVLGWSKKDYRNQNIWLCKCECGNERELSTGVLQSGMSKSCGCLKSELTHLRCCIDISGKRFGKLVAIRNTVEHPRRTPIWECICDCGRTTYVPANHLRSGHTQSCGCEMSFGELMVGRFLMNHNIAFEKQKTFIGCEDSGKLRFDFWLPLYGLCIEFDGQQHYKSVPLWDSDCSLEDRQRRDAIKTKYCEENDIILLRIPYWEKDNIESILTDWLFLHNAGEANSSDVGLSA